MFSTRVRVVIVVLRTSLVSLGELEYIRTTLNSRGVEAYASVYPLENDIEPYLFSTGSSIAPHSLLTSILKSARKVSSLPREIPFLLATRHPGVKKPLLLCSEEVRGCIAACPLQGACDWAEIIDARMLLQ